MEKTDTTPKMPCPCCGAQTFQLPVKPDHQDTQLYLACMLTGQPFSKVYHLFKGKVMLKVSQLSKEQLKSLQALQYIVESCQDPQLKTQMEQLLPIIYSFKPLKYITVQTSDDQHTYRIDQVIQEAMDTLLAGVDLEGAKKVYEKLTDSKLMSSIPAYALQKVINTHLKLVNILVESGFDENFYQGIPQGS